MNEGKRRPGRPQKYKDKAEQMRAQRAKMKKAGYKDIHASIPEEFKDLLDDFCVTTGLTISELVCYLLGCAADQAVAEINKSLVDGQ